MKKRLLFIAMIAAAAWIGLTFFPAVGSAADDVIKVGAVQPVTGRFAFAGVHINAGLEDALNMANEEGGINGKKIQYIMEDGTYTMDVAMAAFKRIMSRDNPVIRDQGGIDR